MFAAYEFRDRLDWRRLAGPLCQASAAVARCDERLRLLPFAEGVAERLVYFEACATRLLEGELVHVEDLVLLESGHFTGRSSVELSSAYEAFIALRHAAFARKARDMPLLAGPRPGEPGTGAVPEERRSELIYDREWDAPGRTLEWRLALKESEGYPPLLTAALVHDAWLWLLPEQHGGWRAPLLGALVLKERKAFRHGLLPLAWGGAGGRWRWARTLGLNERLLGFLDYAVAACGRAQREIERLVLAEALLQRKLEGKRRNSRLPELAALLLKKPYVSGEMAARALKVSREAARLLLKELGSAAREMTGQSRYRLWSV
jgi:hypothetical protein